MTLTFDEVKATQAAARFLRLAGGEYNHMALIKLLYKTDREALRRWGLPVTTDKYSSMDRGPVTSQIYDRIKGSKNPNLRPTFWSTHIQSAGKHLIAITADPGDSELSRAEEELIDEIFAADGGKDPFVLVDECHNSFPEWEDPKGSSKPLEIVDIMSALEFSEEETQHTKSLIEKQRASVRLSAS